MILFTATLAIIAVSIAGWLAPGPNMLTVIQAAAFGGRQNGLATAAGMAVAALLWSSGAMLGLLWLFETLPDLMLTMKLIGGGYLIWLGLRTLKRTRAAFDFDANAPARPIAGFRTGLLISLSNPKSALFYGAVLTAFVPPQAPGWYLLFIVLLSGGLAFGLHSITAYLFSAEPIARRLNAMQATLQTLFGAMFCIFGVAVLLSTLRRA